MFGAYIRAALTVGVAVLGAAVLQFMVPYFLQFQGESDSLLYRSFEGLAENALFIMLVAIAAGVLARAVVESNMGAGR